jgi:hypothetical protein
MTDLTALVVALAETALASTTKAESVGREKVRQQLAALSEKLAAQERARESAAAYVRAYDANWRALAVGQAEGIPPTLPNRVLP